MAKPSSPTDKDKPAPAVNFKKLPERIRPEDLTTVQETEPPPDPTNGRDNDTRFLLWNIG